VASSTPSQLDISFLLRVVVIFSKQALRVLVGLDAMC
jgi:hypothetical protein